MLRLCRRSFGLMLTGVFLWLCVAGSVLAQPVIFTGPVNRNPRFHPAILYERGALESDKAFMEAARQGVQAAKIRLGVLITEYELPFNDDREATLKKMIEDDATHVIAVGFQNVVPVLKLAEKYPDIKFTVIDGIVPPLFNNVQSLIFKDHEGAFLVGMIAAYVSDTGTIGFIGGMDVPLIRNFAYGYLQGARHARKDIKLVTDMIGSTREAWSNPVRGGALAKKQFDQGVDIVFAAAGGSGLGVLNAAKLSDKLAIGVDTNQNGIYPGYVLTSMVKRVDRAMYEVLKSGNEDTWQPGIRYLGLKENALDFAVDSNNRHLISREVIEKVENAKDMIIRGLLSVETYSPEKSSKKKSH